MEDSEFYCDSINLRAAATKPVFWIFCVLTPVRGIEIPTGGHATLLRAYEGAAIMIDGVRYVHTNLIALDWRELAGFYESPLGCKVVPPLRDFPAHAVEAGTGGG